jgi:hypothetical protein
MKFLIRWENHPDKLHSALKAFSAMPAGDPVGDGGSKIKLIGRWHDLASGTGVAVCESDDINALSTWALNWNEVLDVDITPVVDDAEAKAIGATLG